MVTRRERRRLRAVRFGQFMDNADPDWQVPARLEQVALTIYMRLPSLKRGER
jgi:hypothetical protein